MQTLKNYPAGKKETLSKGVEITDKCACNRFVELKSLNKKMCIKCDTWYDFPLKPGQKPMHTSSKDRGL